MKKLSKGAARQAHRLAVAAIAVSVIAVVPAAAQAHRAAVRTCAPSNHGFALSVRAKGVSCSEARGIERYAAHHDWIPFRLYRRTWKATIYSHAHHHTYLRFLSGRLIVWITASRPTPKGGGLPLGSGSPSPGLAGGVACDTQVTRADGSSVPVSDLQVGALVRKPFVGGDEVVSFVATSPASAGSIVLRVRFEDGSEVIASPGAAFFTPGAPERSLADLVPGDQVYAEGGIVQVASIDRVQYGGSLCRLGFDHPTGRFLADGAVVWGWNQGGPDRTL